MYRELIEINNKYIRNNIKDIEDIKQGLKFIESQKERIFLMALSENMGWSILRYKQEIEDYKLKMIININEYVKKYKI